MKSRAAAATHANGKIKNVNRSRPLLLSELLAPALLALLISIGAIKTSPLLSNIPIDLTAFLLVLVVISILVSRIQLGRPNTKILLFLTWPILLLPALHGPGNAYAYTKVILLSTVTLALAVSPFFLLRTRKQIQSFMVTLCTVGAFTALGAFLQTAVGTSRLVTPGGNTIDTGRVVGLSALILLLCALSAQNKPTRRLTALGIGLVLLLATLSTGSRGPSFAILIAIATAMFFAKYFQGLRLRALALTGGVLAFAIYLVSISESSGFARIEQSLLDNGTDNSSGRFQLWGTALEYIQISPFGVGWGGFSELSFDEYPHNIILELFLEAGWLIGLIVTLFFLITFIKGARNSISFNEMLIFSIYCFSLINALFSSDLNGNRLLIVTIIAIWVPRTFSSNPNSQMQQN